MLKLKSRAILLAMVIILNLPAKVIFAETINCINDVYFEKYPESNVITCKVDDIEKENMGKNTIEYLNNLEDDVFVWCGQAENTNDGRGMSKAKAVIVSDTNSVIMKFPPDWDMTNIRLKNLSFWVKSGNAEADNCTFRVSLLNGVGRELVGMDGQAFYNCWENVVIPLYKNGSFIDTTGAQSIQIVGKDIGRLNRLVLDDILLTSESVEKTHVLKAINYENNFDDHNYMSRIDEGCFSGWSKEFEDGTSYADSIHAEVMENGGINNSGCLRVDVSTATSFSGREVYKMPTILQNGNWNLANTDYIEFDMRVEKPEHMPEGNEGGVSKILEFLLTEAPDSFNLNIAQAKLCGYKVALPDEKVESGDWHHFKIPLSAFPGLVKYENILGLAFAAEGGPISNKKTEDLYGDELNMEIATKADFNRVVKLGSFYIDNLRFTNTKDDEVQVESVMLHQNDKVLSALSEAVEGSAQITAVLSNKTGIDKRITMLVGVYDKKTMKLKYFQNVAEDIPLSKDNTVTEVTVAVVLETPRDEVIRVMFWKDIDSMEPMNTYNQAILI